MSSNRLAPFIQSTDERNNTSSKDSNKLIILRAFDLFIFPYYKIVLYIIIIEKVSINIVINFF